jgi:spore coat protein H
MKYYLYLFLLVPFYLFANETVIISPNMYGIDEQKKLIVVNKDIAQLNENYPDVKQSIVLNSTYYFESGVVNLERGISYQVYEFHTNEAYTLYFTDLPIINIRTPHEIVDSPKVWAEFFLSESNEEIISSQIGIEYRGSFSQTFPKKSLEIEFWEDALGEETLDFEPLGMRSDDDWNLQAMYNEPLRFRSKSANALWKEFHQIYYADLEPKAVNGIEMRYVELFLNNEYRGLYAMGEKIDKKQLKLKNHNGEIRGELYKGDEWGNGAVTFSWLGEYDNTSEVWDGFEYKHPDEEINWSNLYNLIDFVMNASDEDFKANYATKFHVDNFVDYFIFLNLAKAADNTGKNTYLAKYAADHPYYYVPWDLDAVFGNHIDGTEDNNTDDFLTNNLYHRLWQDCSENGFRQKTRERWNSVKETIFSYAHLMEVFQSNYNVLSQNLVYERENLAWNEYSMDTNQMDYISSWVGNRWEYLDVVFNEECFMNTQDFSADVIEIYPNPASDILHFNWNNSNKLNVKLYNMVGQMVMKTEVEKSQPSLNISQFESGIYWIQLENESNIQSKKLIISKTK